MSLSERVGPSWARRDDPLPVPMGEDVELEEDPPSQATPAPQKYSRQSSRQSTAYHTPSQGVVRPHMEQSALEERLIYLSEVDLGILNALNILERHFLQDSKRREGCSYSIPDPQKYHPFDRRG